MRQMVCRLIVLGAFVALLVGADIPPVSADTPWPTPIDTYDARNIGPTQPRPLMVTNRPADIKQPSATDQPPDTQLAETAAVTAPTENGSSTKPFVQPEKPPAADNHTDSREPASRSHRTPHGYR